MAKSIVNDLLDRQPAPGSRPSAQLLGGSPGEQSATLRATLRWVRCFWLLAVVVLAGLTWFRAAVADSIASTPHPALVYIIFAVAGVAAALSAALLATLQREYVWFDRFVTEGAAERDHLIANRPAGEPLSALYRLIVQTRGLPLGQRKQALDHELDNAEITVMGRAALPNLLAGSLVGIGLVGTFIGLLGTLHDLSGVFSSFSSVGAAGADNASTFATMIQKLRGPIQGMGTAFVASLYGLLGSLVIGLVGLSVRRVGDELFADLRLFVSDELYHRAAAPAEDPVAGEGELSSAMRILAAVTRDEHGKLREGMEQWTRVLDDRLGKVAEVTANIGTEVQEAADYVGNAAKRSVDSLEKARETNERLFFGMNEVSKGLIDRLDALSIELRDAGGRRQSRIALAALGLALFAVGAALGAIFTGRDAAERAVPAVSASATPAPAAVRASSAPVAGPATAGAIASPASVAAAAAAASGAARHEVVVRRGDTLSGLAQRHGVSLPDMVAANPQIRETDTVITGDTVWVPEH